MLTADSLHLLDLPAHRTFSGSPWRREEGSWSGQRVKVPNSSGAVAFASKRDAYGGGDYSRGRMVDENMGVLRMRIREMKAAESGDYQQAQHDWMVWEKKYAGSGRYAGDICEATGRLQWWLMETRPSLALGAVALMALSVPATVAVAVLHLVQTVKGL